MGAQNLREQEVKEKRPIGQPKKLTRKQTMIILNQQSKSLCQIITKKGKVNGFLCSIPDPVLITSNHVLDGSQIKPGKEIKICFTDENDKKQFKTIKIDKTRTTYTIGKVNEDDIYTTIIELRKEEDKLNEQEFMEIDKDLMIDNVRDAYKTKDIYLIHYNNEEEIGISTGVINEVEKNDKSYTILYKCEEDKASSGCPINLYNHKVIGLYRGSFPDVEFKEATLLQYPIKEYLKKLEQKKLNTENKNVINSDKGKIHDKNKKDNKNIINDNKEKANKEKEIDDKKNKNVVNDDKIKVNKENKIDDKKNKNSDNINDKKNQNIKMIDNNFNKNNIKDDSHIAVTYKINKKYKGIRIFDRTFVSNNKMKCKMVINDKEYDMSDYIKYTKYNINKNNDLLTITLIGINNINDASCMFGGCSSLQSLSDISKWDTKNVNNMRCMFSGCISLQSLPDISKWDTKNVTNMYYMFYKCSSLISLPDISKWDTKNVTSAYGMFGGCSSLKSLPDISKWDIKNITNMHGMFWGCNSLQSLPDISKWDTKNVTNMNSMFRDCRSLQSLPDISKWDTKNVTNIGNMFDGCSPTLNIPSKYKKDCIIY